MRTPMPILVLYSSIKTVRSALQVGQMLFISIQNELRSEEAEGRPCKFSPTELLEKTAKRSSDLSTREVYIIKPEVFQRLFQKNRFQILKTLGPPVCSMTFERGLV